MEKEQEMLNPEAVAQFLADKGIISMEQVENLVEPSLFVIIPMSVKERRDLSANAKLLYGEIMALARRKGFCYATNQYIAERMGLAKSSITAIIRELKNKNLIKVEIRRVKEGTYRRITINPVNYQTVEIVEAKEDRGLLHNDRGFSQTEEGGSAVEGSQKRYRQRDIDNKSISKEIQAKPDSYGNKDINKIYDYLKEKISGTPDGTIKENRRFAKLLLDKFRKDYPNHDPAEVVCTLIDISARDDFHSKNSTSFKYLYYNSQKIIKAFKGRNNKYIKL